MCQEWKKMLKYRFLLAVADTSDGPPLRYTARRVLPLADTFIHSFVVSSSGVIFAEGFSALNCAHAHKRPTEGWSFFIAGGQSEIH